jgi:hypothetical protein
MRTSQLHFYKGKWNTKTLSAGFDPSKCSLVLSFGSRECISDPAVFKHIRTCFPDANILFASTSGEIMGDNVYDDSVVVTAAEFEKTEIRCVATNIKEHKGSYETGLYLMTQLENEGLNAVFIISDGAHINGSELVAGLNENNLPNIPITGGLAGDAARFTQTLTGLNAAPTEGNVIAVGFYGKNLLVGHGSFGGWDEFGPERIVTKSIKNVLYEIDGKNALELYKQYLGDYVNELPGSALLFPLSLRMKGKDENLVRTILSIDETGKSMTFAGNLPEGSTVRLMKANFDKLIEGSSDAASFSFEGIRNKDPELAILISCVGRKLILQERTEEELQAAKEILGDNAVITGFYSYGEISPFNPSSRCELHNQTMTITTFREF